MRAGDHLAARRGGERDHAIDLGDRTVLRFAPGRGFRRLALAEFADGTDRLEVVVHRERTYPPAAVVARAFSRLSQAAFGGMFQSAEQFAAWCKSGVLPAAATVPAPARRARGMPSGSPKGKGAGSRAPGRKARTKARGAAKRSGTRATKKRPAGKVPAPPVRRRRRGR